MMLQFERSIRVQGKGATKVEAFQAALVAMRQRVLKEHSEAILHMEPVACNIVSAIKHSKTDRFLGFLFPKERALFSLTVDLTVAMKVVDIDAVRVTVRSDAMSLAQHLLEMR